jgi:cell division protein FtsA
MPGADELAQDILNFPVRTGFPESITGLNEMIYSPMHATGVGLLRYGLGSGEPHFSPLLSNNFSLFNRFSSRIKEWMHEFF